MGLLLKPYAFKRIHYSSDILASLKENQRLIELNFLEFLQTKCG